MDDKRRRIENLLKRFKQDIFRYKGKSWPIVENRSWSDFSCLSPPEKRGGGVFIHLMYKETHQGGMTPEEREWYDAYWAHYAATKTEKEKQKEKEMRRIYEKYTSKQRL